MGGTGPQLSGPRAEVTMGSPQSRRMLPGAAVHPGHPPPALSVEHCQEAGAGSTTWPVGRSPNEGMLCSPHRAPQMEIALCPPSNTTRVSSGLFLTQNWVHQSPQQLLIPLEMQKVCVNTIRGGLFPCRNPHPSIIVTTCLN